MVEVRVKGKGSNAIDAGMHRRGLVPREQVRSTDLQVDGNRQRVITNPDYPNSAVIRIR